MKKWKGLCMFLTTIPFYLLMTSCEKGGEEESSQNSEEVSDTTLSSETSEKTNPGDLRIMSYNMRFENINSPDQVYPWRTRVYGVVESFEKYQPDVVGTQELERWQHNLLMSELGDSWASFGESRDGRNGENNAIYYRKERVELLEQNTIWLSETPDKPNSKSWDAAHPRILTYGKFKLIENGFEFLFLNTHLDHKSAEARKKGLEIVIDMANNYEGIPAFITGDFNMNITSEEFAPLSTNENFENSFTKYAEKFDPNGATFHGFEGKKAGRPIDFIFYTSANFNLLSTDIIYDKFEDRYFLSDHYPVLSVFNFNK